MTTKTSDRHDGTVGFVGIGSMGLPMVEALVAAGYPVVVFDTRAAAMETLPKTVHRAASVKDVADSCKQVFLSLPTLESCRQVVLGPGGLVEGHRLRTLINTSTVGVRFAEELAGELAPHNVALVDCPVSGGADGVRQRSLSVMVSGDPAAVASVHAILSVWGTVHAIGPRPGMAQLLKLTNNILSAVAIAATAEAYVMGAKGGLDVEVMNAAINAGSGRNGMTLQKVPAYVLTRSFDFGGTLQTLMKDVDLAIEYGESQGVPMWVCQAARLVVKHAVFAGMGNRDVTELVKVVEAAAGFELPKTR